MAQEDLDELKLQAFRVELLEFVLRIGTVGFQRCHGSKRNGLFGQKDARRALTLCAAVVLLMAVNSLILVISSVIITSSPSNA